MLHYFTQLDQQLFLWIQHHVQNSFFDLVMPWLRNKKKTWYPLYFCIVVLLIYKFGWVGFRITLIGIFCFLVSDLLSSQVMKPTFKRLRPCEEPLIAEQFTPKIKCGNRGYSFTSSHASNHFAVALGLSLFFFSRKKWLLLSGVIWAGSIALAQVYVGVHYPLDILAGALLGSSISIGIHYIIKRYFSKYFVTI